MARTYLWCQGWPWFLPAFPFDRFEHLEGLDLVAALAAFGSSWAAEHQAELATAREVKRKRRLMREGAQSTFPRPQQRAAMSDATNQPRPPSFEEVAIVAGWALRPCGVVFEYPVLGGLQPLPRIYFYATEDATVADGVLDVLRESAFSIPLGTGFGEPRSVFRGGLDGGFGAMLRFGKVCTDGLGQTARVLIAREFEDFSERADRFSNWVVPIAEEAVRCERLLMAERTPSIQSKPTKKTGRPSTHDLQGDKRIYDGRKQGQTYAALSAALDRPVKDVRYAYERERKRRSRLAKQSEGPDKR